MKVSLFITCIVDQMYPQVGADMVKLLTRLGVEVTFNPHQTCCGQPAFNMGHRREAREVARHMLEVFEQELQSADYLVAPSGSCVTMVRKFYALLFSDSAQWRERAERVGARVYELSEFLVDVLGVTDVGADFRGKIYYHEACHLLRELGVSSQPRKLLGAVRGAELADSEQAATCCGFGGAFSVMYPHISTAIVAEKISSIERSGADTLIACDVGCLMQIDGLLKRHGSSVRCLHLSELLVSREAGGK
jgi:L-lactate dehydrogenase complex protein LldE